MPCSKDLFPCVYWEKQAVCHYFQVFEHTMSELYSQNNELKWACFLQSVRVLLKD